MLTTTVRIVDYVKLKSLKVEMEMEMEILHFKIRKIIKLYLKVVV